jgi:Flp pilus assembly protein CpaB
MVATALSPTRALAEPWRPNRQVLVGLLIALIAVVGSLSVWKTTTDTQAVLSTTRDLPAGARITAADLATSHVRLDDRLSAAVIPAAELATVIGKQVGQPVGAHQLLARAQLSPRTPLAPDQMAMTVPVAADSAVGGRLQPGDAVQVVATLAKGRPESRSVVVLPRVTIYAVDYDERVAVVNTAAAAPADAPDRGTAGGIASVTVLVNQDQVLALSQARWNADVDLILLPPAG